MPFTLTRRYAFTARHFLPTLPEGHPSRELHPHDFRVELVVEGEADPSIGWVVDYNEIDRLFQPWLDRMRDSVLNDIEGLSCPSAEQIARFLYGEMKPVLPLLTEVRVSESPDDLAAYREN